MAQGNLITPSRSFQAQTKPIYDTCTHPTILSGSHMNTTKGTPLWRDVTSRVKRGKVYIHYTLMT